MRILLLVVAVACSAGCAAVLEGLQAGARTNAAGSQPGYQPPPDPPRHYVVTPPPGCSSDFDCGGAQLCVKENYASAGTCMQKVNEYGNPDYSMPRLDSINAKTPSPSDCDAGRLCPAGFRCDYSSGYCVR